MCMEDVRIARNSRTFQTVVVVNTTSTPLLDANNNRIAWTIDSPITNTVTLSLAPSAVANNGIRLKSTDNPLSKCLADSGDLVTRRLMAIAPAGAETITIWETILDDV